MDPSSPTLARKLGTTSHLSPLLQKARKLGLRQAEDLERLAILRGCSYYREDDGTSCTQVDRSDFSDAELAIALLHPAIRYHPRTLRLGAAMLGSPQNTAAQIAWLVRMERAETVVREIAKAGAAFEADNRFWKMLLELIPDSPPAKSGVIPHASRFVAMTGLTRAGTGCVGTWIRPAAA